MTITTTNRPASRGSRGRIPAVAAFAVAAGIALAGCAADDETASPPPPSTQVSTSSSSSSSSTTSSVTEAPAPAEPTADPVTDPVAVASPAAEPLPEAPATLPAVVVDIGGPCHMLGDLAQGMDGEPLFCLNDPGGAGPLWLPPPTAAPGEAPAMADQPCVQQDASVTAPDGTTLTCRLSGDGSTPGGLFWRS